MIRTEEEVKLIGKAPTSAMDESAEKDDASPVEANDENDDEQLVDTDTRDARHLDDLTEEFAADYLSDHHLTAAGIQSLIKFRDDAQQNMEELKNVK